MNHDDICAGTCYGICEEDDTCIIEQSTCNNKYVCPKVTEKTHCSNGGINGYTTYIVSLVIQPNMDIKNIYAMYGDEDHVMHIPKAYQGNKQFNKNIGGISQAIININPDSNYDSWLTIGITDGDQQDKVSTIGIDFDLWTEEQSLDVDNGAVFLMNPEEVLFQNEYIVGQLTIPTNEVDGFIINVQGKLIHSNNPWKELGIIFILQSTQRDNSIPPDCKSWYDGCNTCIVNNGVLGGCTRLMCFTEDTPRCLSYVQHAIGH